jgi:hypothetical protein
MQVFVFVSDCAAIGSALVLRAPAANKVLRPPAASGAFWCCPDQLARRQRVKTAIKSQES